VAASVASPATNSAQARSSIVRPPPVSMRRPGQGLTSAPISSAADSTANTVGGVVPRLRAIGSASSVGR
jgi:hypothetical protein